MYLAGGEKYSIKKSATFYISNTDTFIADIGRLSLYKYLISFKNSTYIIM